MRSLQASPVYAAHSTSVGHPHFSARRRPANAFWRSFNRSPSFTPYPVRSFVRTSRSDSASLVHAASCLACVAAGSFRCLELFDAGLLDRERDACSDIGGGV